MNVKPTPKLCSYQLNIKLPDEISPFTLSRKSQRRKPQRWLSLSIAKITEIEPEECQCIMVSHDRHLYLTDAYIATHNSTTASSIITSFAGQAPGLIIPTESMPGDYLDKLAAFKANIPFDLIETGELDNDQYNKVMAVYSWLEERCVHFLDELNPSSKLVEAIVRDGIKRYGYQWVAIDSINNLSSLLHSDIFGRTSEAADVAQKLARMGLTVLITSQVGRNMKGRKNKIPKLNDALGSGRVEQNADVVVALYNHDYYVRNANADPDARYPAGIMMAKCLKHRHRGGAEGHSKLLTFKGGIGVYD